MTSGFNFGSNFISFAAKKKELITKLGNCFRRTGKRLMLISCKELQLTKRSEERLIHCFEIKIPCCVKTEFFEN